MSPGRSSFHQIESGVGELSTSKAVDLEAREAGRDSLHIAGFTKNMPPAVHAKDMYVIDRINQGDLRAVKSS